MFEVLIEVPSSPECHYVTEMQKIHKVTAREGRGESVRGDRGIAERGRRKPRGSTKDMDEGK